MEIRRGKTKGNPFFEVDGSSDLNDVTKKITGVTWCDRKGIFSTSRRVAFEYGEERNTIQFAEELSIMSDNKDELARKIRERVLFVRHWVNGIDFEERFCIEL